MLDRYIYLFKSPHLQKSIISSITLGLLFQPEAHLCVPDNYLYLRVWHHKENKVLQRNRNYSEQEETFPQQQSNGLPISDPASKFTSEQSLASWFYFLKVLQRGKPLRSRWPATRYWTHQFLLWKVHVWFLCSDRHLASLVSNLHRWKNSSYNQTVCLPNLTTFFQQLILKREQNQRLTRAGPTPTNISKNSEPLTVINGTLASPAVALARSVFPVPGGPVRIAPCKRNRYIFPTKKT